MAYHGSSTGVGRDRVGRGLLKDGKKTGCSRLRSSTWQTNQLCAPLSAPRVFPMILKLYPNGRHRNGAPLLNSRPPTRMLFTPTPLQPNQPTLPTPTRHKRANMSDRAIYYCPDLGYFIPRGSPHALTITPAYVKDVMDIICGMSTRTPVTRTPPSAAKPQKRRAGRYGVQQLPRIPQRPPLVHQAPAPR